MKFLCLVLLMLVAVAIDQSSAIIRRVPVWPPPLQTVTVAYNVGDGTSDVSIKLRVPSQITGQTVMEIAANFDTRFRFTAQYFSNDLGYSLRAIGDVTADSNIGEFWQFQVGTAAFQPYSVSPVGYSNWYPFNGSIMRWQLSNFLDGANHTAV